MPRKRTPLSRREWRVSVVLCARCGHPFYLPFRSKHRYCEPCRFWVRVDASGGAAACWPWRGAVLANGYGFVKWRGGQWKAHRLALALTCCPPPPEVLVLHTCDTRLCCNPRHLWFGTHQANMDDMRRKGRAASGDRHFARLHPASLARGVRNGKYTRPEQTPRGERHGRATYTAEQVTAIRRRYLEGETNSAALARLFGGTKGGVYALLKGRTWNHLPWPDPPAPTRT